MTTNITTITTIPAQRDPRATWGLVERVRDGDGDAFAELYRRYSDVVLRYAYHRTHSWPVAEDIAGEVWVKGVRRIPGLTWQGRDVGAWLITVARNLVADRFKSGRYRLEICGEQNGDQAIDASQQPEHIAATRSRNASLATAIGRLPGAQGDVVRLRFFHELSVADTAARIGVSVGAVKALQYRAVRALRRLLENEGFTR